MSLLVLNKRDILDKLTRWFPDSARSIVLLTARRALAGMNIDALARRVRHLEIVDDYPARATGELAESLCRRYGIERVLTTAESDVIRAAVLRQRLGLPGQQPGSAIAYCDKYVMKSHARLAGIPVAPMRIVSRGEEVAEFVADHGLPVVVKPLDGGGSVGVEVLTDIFGLARWVCAWDGRPRLAERWVDGPMFHVDGLMRDGTVLHAWPSSYLYTNWETVNRALPDISSMLPRDSAEFEQLLRSADAVVAALPPTPDVSPFHAEFFLSGGGEPILCEIACRAGGAGIVETYERACGVNLYAAGLLGQAGRPVGLPGHVTRYGYAWFPAERGILARIPETCALPEVVRYQALGRVGQEYHGPACSTDRIAEAVFRVRDTAVPERMHRWWREAVAWRTDAELITASKGEEL